MQRPTAGAGAFRGGAALVRLSTPRLQRRVRLVLFAWAVVGALLALGTLQLHLASDPLADVHAYYDAAARLNAGLPLYEQAATTNQAEFYRYPPLLAIAFRPLAQLPFAAAAAAWELLVLGSFAATILVLGARRPEVWVLAGILGLPIGWSLAIGQAQVPVTLLLALGAPWSVALAGQLKVLPALAAVYWLGRRDWRSLGVFAGVTIALVAVQLALEPRGTLDFLGVFGLGQVGEVRNISPYVLSPWLWAAFVVAGLAVAVRLAPGRWGWAAAVTISVVASPRLLVYMLMSLLAGLRTWPGGAATGGPPGSAPAPPPEPARAGPAA